MGGEGAAPIAETLSIAKVAVYQATEVTLSKNGNTVQANAPVVANRGALLRVWVAPSTTWTARSITGELTVSTPTSSRTARASVSVSAASTDPDLASTFAFDLRPGELTEATALSVVLREANGLATLERWPKLGDYALSAASSNGDFLVTLVPLVAGGITPKLDAQAVARFQRYLSRVYPASGVDMAVRAAVPVDVDVLPDGTGWDEALAKLYATRDADDPAPNVYYFGVLTPEATFGAYCGSDCVVGLSTVATAGDEADRGAIGTGYFENDLDTFSQETMAHELGHALGREHAPCGEPDGVDRAYPYQFGQIGVFGYDGKNLRDKDDYKDEMSYCVPVWISDYTWSALFERISTVNGFAPRRIVGAERSRQRYRTLAVRADGSLRWGHERRPASAPGGEAVNVELLDRNGAVLDVITGAFARFDHLPGGFVSVSAAPLEAPDVASVRVNGAVLPLR